MWTIIWISLGWLAMSVLMAWVWHRIRAVEYREEYTEKEVQMDDGEAKYNRFTCGETDSASFAGMDAADKATMDDLVEGLARIFAKDDLPEAWPEDRSKRSRIIGDIVKELVFGNGKED